LQPSGYESNALTSRLPLGYPGVYTVGLSFCRPLHLVFSGQGFVETRKGIYKLLGQIKYLIVIVGKERAFKSAVTQSHSSGWLLKRMSLSLLVNGVCFGEWRGGKGKVE
jgi:hypothetical protein